MTTHLADAVPSAVLWDMDGTVIDSEPLWLAAELTMLSRYGIELTDDTRDRIVGSGLRAAAALFQELGVPMSSDDIIAEWTAAVIAGLHAGEPAWRPGALELLASLRAAGIPSALVTMAFREIADAVVELLPPGTFVTIVAGDEVAHEKPHPDPYLRGAAAVGVPVERCVAIEDSPTGLRSAHAAGAVAIGVPNLVDLTTAPSHELWPTLAGVDATRLAERFRSLRELSPTAPDSERDTADATGDPQ
ncbi:HAD family phosphatase [Leucobacter rhizosphaerae]|uniref:HAD family phosphatase n=1 Tax=Leucobacter rhizosphaerae TaxID=2932245 RepID=A0ABY4FXL8_9MICO|nr:HAD family phosphatase [Leucobacter rhizosphaerae]UOQ61015.1 HAD family phosphatase [Leucobacter rhizosphaerae]